MGVVIGQSNVDPIDEWSLKVILENNYVGTVEEGNLERVSNFEQKKGFLF